MGLLNVENVESPRASIFWDTDTLKAVEAKTARALFEMWADTLEEDTRHVASPFAVACHPAHQKILAMKKEEVIPLILRRMQKKGGQWFWALAALAKENPASDRDRGNIKAMRNAWIRWGQKHGHI